MALRNPFKRNKKEVEESVELTDCSDCAVEETRVSDFKQVKRGLLNAKTLCPKCEGTGKIEIEENEEGEDE